MTDLGPRGRRDNGLSAAAFSSVGDVDPRVGEHLLDVLYLNGIAAYLQPTVDYDAVTRAVSLPRQPTDRLWADRRRADDARTLVAAEAASAGRLPPASSLAPPPPTAAVGPAVSPQPAVSPGPVDEDAAWAQIVAFFDRDDAGRDDAGRDDARRDGAGSHGAGQDGDGRPARSGGPPWPAAEDIEPAARGRRRRHDDAPGDAPWPAEPLADAVPPTEEEEERYIPPPPPPLPRISAHTLGAVLAVALGVFLLALGPRLLGIDPDSALKLGILAIVAGISYLVWRMRDGPGQDRPDDGAVV